MLLTLPAVKQYETEELVSQSQWNHRIKHKICQHVFEDIYHDPKKKTDSV